MDLGTGIVLFGIWMYASVCVASKESTAETAGIGFGTAVVFTIGLTVISYIH